MALDLPSLDAAIRAPRPNAKPEPRKRLKGRKDRAEAKVKKDVRAACVERDGYCSVFGRRTNRDVGGAGVYFIDPCEGPSQWMHMHTKRRSQTRGQAPDVRHTTADSLMGCQKHHDQYDGRRRPRLLITKLTRKGADGPLKFRRGK